MLALLYTRRWACSGSVTFPGVQLSNGRAWLWCRGPALPCSRHPVFQCCEVLKSIPSNWLLPLCGMLTSSFSFLVSTKRHPFREAFLCFLWRVCHIISPSPQYSTLLSFSISRFQYLIFLFIFSSILCHCWLECKLHKDRDFFLFIIVSFAFGQWLAHSRHPIKLVNCLNGSLTTCYNITHLFISLKCR